MRNAAAIWCDAAASSTRPRERVSLSEWADKNRMLSGKAAAEPGRWRTSRTPFLREIMDCLSDTSPVQRVIVKKPTQIGATEIALNWIGYHIDRELGPMLVVLPTLELRRRWSLQRLAPMLRDTESLAKKYNQRKRDASNAEDLKDFDNAMLVLSGSNSESSLSSMPMRHIICDEVDRFPWSVGGEGDPLGLIRQRAIAFANRKELLVSSPTIKDASRIDEEYEQSDQRSYHVPCPHCGHYQALVWDQLLFIAADSDSLAVSRAFYACVECGAEIDEHAKPKMLAAGRWVPRYPQRKTRGYHLNGLYAPIGLGNSWVELAENWLKSHKDPLKLKRFINTSLGEVWEDQSRRVKTNEIADRVEPYQLREIPPGCLLLTAGVDVQDDRLAILIIGHGANDAVFVIDWLELPGDPGRPELWNELTDYLKRPLINSFGRSLRVEATAIDTGGHYTQEVYQWARARRVPNAMAVKGASTPGRPIIGTRPSYIDLTKRNKADRRKLQLWTVGTDTAKHALVGRLVGDADQPVELRRLRFSEGLPLDFFEQLTAEVFDPERKKWVVKRGRRNEATDCFVYATAASHHPRVRVQHRKAHDWQALAAIVEAPNEKRDNADLNEKRDRQPPAQPTKPRRRRPRLPGGVR